MKKPLAALASAMVLGCAPGVIQAAPLVSSDPAVAAATKKMRAAMKQGTNIALWLVMSRLPRTAVEGALAVTGK